MPQLLEALELIEAYSPDQARDDSGRFADEGGGSSSSGSSDHGGADFTFELDDSHDSTQWTPTKTPEAATAWAKDSSVTQTLYHGTSVDIAEKIKDGGFKTGQSAFGTGVYLAIGRDLAEGYQRGVSEGKGAVIETKINVSKILPIKDTPQGYKDAAKRLGMSPQDFTKATKSNLSKAKGSQLVAQGEAIREAAERQGYHGLKVDSPRPFYVVFDPQRVTTIEHGVKAYSPDQERDDHGRWVSEGGGSPVDPAVATVNDHLSRAASNSRAFEDADALRPSLSKLSTAEAHQVAEKLGINPERSKKATVDKIVRKIKDRAEFGQRMRDVKPMGGNQ